MNLFQSLVLAAFGLLAIAAVIIFSITSSGGGDIGFSGTFILWGTLPAESVQKSLKQFNAANSKFFSVEYVEKRKETFESDLVSALAAGKGPDLVIMPETLIIQNSDKVLLIPYESYPIRNFNDDFADGASLFMAKSGIFAMPLYIDPLVMYWNKDIFSTGGVATYPTKWNEFENLSGRLTISNRGGSISQATVALGTYANIEHAKDILSALFIQSGNEMIRFAKRGEVNSDGLEASYKVLLGFGDKSAVESALNFFLDFSNPAKKAYSWNTAMSNSKAAFAGGILAVYFGHATDRGDIQKSNPHLNFDVATFPQREGEKKRVTFGNIYGVAITRGTSNYDIAKQIAIGMSGADFARSLSSAISLPPARRDLLSEGSSDPVESVFYSSAIMSKSWLDPLPSESDQVIQEMAESVLSGLMKSTGALSTAGQKLDNLVTRK